MLLGAKKFPQEVITSILHNHMLDTHGGNVERDEVFAVFPRNVTTSIQHNHVLDISRMSVQSNEVFMVGQMIFVYIMSSNFTPTYDLKRERDIQTDRKTG